MVLHNLEDCESLYGVLPDTKPAAGIENIADHAHADCRCDSVCSR